MARPLPGTNLTRQKLTFLPAPLSLFIILTAVVSVFTLLTFLCGAHERIAKSLRGKEGKRTVRLGGGKKERMKSSLSNKALLMSKMISWRKVQDDEGSEDDVPRKRAKVEPTEAPARPQWSNPDPYTVLPPPETLGAPKKDIVQVIRKAKNEQASKSEGADNVAGNADFISFNFGDDDNSNKVDEVLNF